MKVASRSGVTKFIPLTLVAAMGLATTVAYAGGFQLFEANVAGLGDAGASFSTWTEDASANFFNPAGITAIRHQEFSTAATAILVEGRYTGTSTWTTSNPIIAPLGPYTEQGTSTINDVAVVPALHYVAPITDRFSAGISVTSPFGLETKYNATAVNRYANTDSRLITVDIGPTFAFKFNDHFSAGAGFDAEYANVHFDAMAGLPTNLVNPYPMSLDTRALNKGDDWAWGWHGGLMISFTENTRFGIAYHSSIKHCLKGTSRFTGPLASGSNAGTDIVSGNVRATVKLPAWTSFGLYHRFNQQWAVMGNAIYTQWDSIKNIVLTNVAGLNAQSMAATNLTVSSAANFCNTWRLGFGANYSPNEVWTLRAGVGFDQTPTNNTDRDLRIPDPDRVLLSLGAHLQASEKVGMDFGFMHLLSDGAKINKRSVSGTQTVQLRGNFKGNVNLVGAQLNVKLT
jgi:long-chain fatty acid transport protein